MRKKKDKINIKQMEDVFQLNPDKLEIVAYYLKLGIPVPKLDDGGDLLEIEYLNNKQLKTLCIHRKKALNCMIQKFITPKDNRSHVIKVVWSPQFCLLYKKTNNNDLNNSKIDINSRISSFDSSDKDCNSEPISSPMLVTDIEKLCLNMVHHIQEISGGNTQITQMNFYLKLDENNKMWLLFCTKMKILDKADSICHNGEHVTQLKVNSKNDRIKSPRFKILKPNDLNEYDDILKKFKINAGLVVCKINKNQSHCVNCLKETSELYDIKLSYLIRDDPNPPPDILAHELDQVERIWGKRHQNKKLKMFTNKFWKDLNSKVCANCYTKSTEDGIMRPHEKLVIQKKEKVRLKILDDYKFQSNVTDQMIKTKQNRDLNIQNDSSNLQVRLSGNIAANQNKLFSGANSPANRRRSSMNKLLVFMDKIWDKRNSQKIQSKDVDASLNIVKNDSSQQNQTHRISNKGTSQFKQDLISPTKNTEVIQNKTVDLDQSSPCIKPQTQVKQQEFLDSSSIRNKLRSRTERFAPAKERPPGNYAMRDNSYKTENWDNSDHCSKTRISDLENFKRNNLKVMYNTLRDPPDKNHQLTPLCNNDISHQVTAKNEYNPFNDEYTGVNIDKDINKSRQKKTVNHHLGGTVGKVRLKKKSELSKWLDHNSFRAKFDMFSPSSLTDNPWSCRSSSLRGVRTESSFYPKIMASSRDRHIKFDSLENDLSVSICYSEVKKTLNDMKSIVKKNFLCFS